MIKKRLVSLLADSKKYIGYMVLWQWLALLAQVLAVFTASDLLERAIFSGGDLSPGRSLPVFLGVLLVRFFCDRMGAEASYRASADVKRILRERIYEKLLRLGASYREKISTSEVVQMSAEGVEQLETYFGRYLPQLFYSMLAPVTLFAILCRVSFQASLVLLICVPLIPLSIVAVQKIAKRLLDRYWSIYAGLGDSFLENLQGLTTLKIYQADGRKAEEMDEEARHFRRITMKVLTMQLNSTSVMDIVAYGGAALGMIAAGTEFLAGNLGFQGALSILLLASEFFLPLRLLGSYFHIAMNGMAASDKIFRLLDMEEPEEGAQRLAPSNKKGMDIFFQNVHFSYETDREILKGIDLCLPAGSFISLVGESGCGKSTIAGLLSGRNRNYAGHILVNGQELSDIREADLMRQVTLVSHNSYLFKGTVEENLRMARPDASEEELLSVLDKVNLLGFLETQSGLKTFLAEQGSNLSGGQCQRLSLARALLHDTPVYIFDEATSNIDAESEDMILKVIHELAQTKTVLLISHRLSNVVGSDCICLLREGRIEQTGTHEELMGQGGAYRELYVNQQELEKIRETAGKEAGA
ncbi:MAG: ABC transporter ATP-binding protein/permease [Lachnospiraceae bacterium]|nr:ABC transporter ATP-binding protein/permease [Lachnospiraceae bacterium]